MLVVDDEEIVRRTAKFMLERYGYTVVVAENGKEGVELFRALGERVSAVLLDVTMPVMGGHEAIGHLKAIDPTVKVLLSSGNTETEATRRFKGIEFSGFIQKPYSSSVLAKKIKAVLEDKEEKKASAPGWRRASFEPPSGHETFAGGVSERRRVPRLCSRKSPDRP